jgi:hypothetical protein
MTLYGIDMAESRKCSTGLVEVFHIEIEENLFNGL